MNEYRGQCHQNPRRRASSLPSTARSERPGVSSCADALKPRCTTWNVSLSSEQRVRLRCAMRSDVPRAARAPSIDRGRRRRRVRRPTTDRRPSGRAAVSSRCGGLRAPCCTADGLLWRAKRRWLREPQPARPACLPPTNCAQPYCVSLGTARRGPGACSGLSSSPRRCWRATQLRRACACCP